MRRKHSTLDIKDLEAAMKASSSLFAQEERGIDFLLQAAAQGNIKELERVLALGVAIWAMDNEGRNAATVAIQNSHISALEFLLHANVHLPPSEMLPQVSLLGTAAQLG